MKQFLKKLLITVAVLFTAATSISLTSATPTYADDGNTYSCRYFLGMTSWDCGVPGFDNTDSLQASVLIIISNVLTDLTVIATYLVIGFVIYGGYMYIFASGDVGKVQSGKKTLTRAFIGLAIVGSANIILNAIRFAFVRNATLSPIANDPAVAGELVLNIANWFIGIAGVIALFYVVIGGIGYITSAGDAGKLQKSKNTILYALIGLAVVALSFTITALFSNTIKDAGNTSLLDNQTIIAKELK